MFALVLLIVALTEAKTVCTNSTENLYTCSDSMGRCLNIAGKDKNQKEYKSSKAKEVDEKTTKTTYYTEADCKGEKWELESKIEGDAPVEVKEEDIKDVLVYVNSYDNSECEDAFSSLVYTKGCAKQDKMSYNFKYDNVSYTLTQYTYANEKCEGNSTYESKVFEGKKCQKIGDSGLYQSITDGASSIVVLAILAIIALLF